MSSNTLARWCGLALVLGGLLAIVAQFLFRAAGPLGTIAQLESPLWTAGQATQLVGALLILLGLPVVYARQKDRLGAFGLIAYVLFFVGLTTELVGPANGMWLAELAGRPETRSLVEARIMPVGLGLILFTGLVTLWIGAVAFGVSVIRAGVFARATGLLLIVAVVLDLVGGIALRTSLFGPELALGAIAWLGFQVIAGSRDTRPASHAASAAAPG